MQVLLNPQVQKHFVPVQLQEQFTLQANRAIKHEYNIGYNRQDEYVRIS